MERVPGDRAVMDADGAFRRLAGQAAGVLFVVGGLMCVADAPAAARGPGAFVAFVAMGGLAVAAGVVLLRLPWQRWPRRATLWIVAPALLVSGLTGYLDPSPYVAAIPFFLLALWLGISQPRGTALALSPATALAYWAPIALAPHAPGLVASVPFVTVTCALVGETLAWLTTRLGEAQQRLRDYEAFHDRLTGLPNRASFGDQLRRARARSQRLAVLFCGLDGFKSVNDRLGHAAGDAVLVEVARRLTQAARPVDLAARLGGDEFAVLVEDWGDEPELLAMAEHLRRSLVTPVRLGERQALVGMSVGIAAGPASGSTDLLADAGLAMVEAKRDKGGGVAVYHPRIRRGLVARTVLLADLEHAVERGELRVHYQPIVDLGDGHVLGVEALVRWAHPRRGLLGPDQFIAAAEQSGLITSIGRWVLEQACLQVRGWQRRLPELAELQLSVNLSPLQLASDAVVGEVAAALDNSGQRHRHRAGPLDRRDRPHAGRRGGRRGDRAPLPGGGDPRDGLHPRAGLPVQPPARRGRPAGLPLRPPRQAAADRGGRPGARSGPLEHRLERVVDVAVAAVGVGVLLVALRVGHLLLRLVGDERRDGVGHAGVQAGSDRREDRGAGGGRLHAAGDAHWQAGHVRLDLPPQRPLGPAADDRQATDLQPCVAHRLEDVAQRVGAALQQRPGEVRPGVGEGQPVEDATGGPVPLGGHGPLHAGQVHQALRARGQRRRGAGDQVVGVAVAASLRLPLPRRELVPPPAQVAAGDEPGVLQQPDVGVGVRVALDQQGGVRARLGGGGADRLGGADHVADLTGGEDAGAEGGGHLVAAAHHHDRLGRQAGGCHELGGDPAGRLGPGGQLGEHRRVDAGGLQDRRRPGPGARVEQGERGGVGVVDRQHAGGLAQHVRAGRHQLRRLGEDFRLLVADPQRLEDRVRGVQVGADQTVELLRRQLAGEGGGLRLRPPVHPDHRRPQRLAAPVAHDHAVELRPERQPLHRRRPLRHLGQQPRDRGVQRRGPQSGVLLGPARVGEGHVVSLVGGGHQGAVGRVERRVGPLAADVAADHVGRAHGRMTIFSPAPERIVSNAWPISSSGKRWVTTAASSSRRRSR